VKVLHVIPSVGPQRGGPSQAVLDMVRGLSQAGVTVHLATTDDDGPGRLSVPLGRPVVEGGVTCWYFPRQTRFYTASWPLTTWLWHHVADYDLVHAHAVFSYSSLPAAFCAWRAGIPYIITPHGILRSWGVQNRRPLLKRLSFCLIERRILRHAALVHYTSEQERLEVEESGVRTPSAVIPLGIDLSPFERLPASDGFRHHYPQLAGRMLLLFLSRLDPIKGLDLLLPAFTHVRQDQPDAALALAGRGAPDYETWLRARVQELGLKGDVLFTGFLEGEQKLAVLADCDLFVLPSYSESFGVAAVEAMACGKPVVISNQVAIHREIAKADAGLVVPCQVEALAEALMHLAGDADLCRRLGTNGRRLAQERFSLEAMATRLAQVYTEVAQPSLRVAAV
jgi:glycosyltransferase involved in cell wall biosynthesis